MSARAGPSEPRSNPPIKDRSALLAAVLAGLAPPLGHFYVGRPWRGLFLLGLVSAAYVLWVRMAALSWTAARLSFFPLGILTLVLIADATWLARRAPRPFHARSWQGAWTYGLVAFFGGLVLPAASTAYLGRHVALLAVVDDAMEGAGLSPLDQVVVHRTAFRKAPPRRGDVVAVEAPDGAVLVRRVMGVSDGELLVLPDRRHPSTEAARIPDSQVVGLVTYLLLPSDFDVLRVGEPIR